MKKVIALNLKAYAESGGESGVRLAKAADLVAAKSGVEIIVCPQTPQLELFSSTLKHAAVFSQHADAVDAGAKTGWLTLDSIKAAGASGTLINHSEHRVSPEHVKFVVEKSVKLGLRAIVCAATVDESIALAKLGPWAVAFEPPELIGSGVSVSTAQPEIVEHFVSRMRKEAPKVTAIVGAGVSTAADVKKCFELGADGVLLASAFVKAKDPKALLEEMSSV